jgi:chromosome segregation ATPase
MDEVRTAWERVQEPELVYGEIVDDDPASVMIDLSGLEASEEEGFYEQPGQLGDASELLNMLVSRFEESLVGREREIDALRRSLEEAQDLAAGERAELETTTQVCRILERENNRLKTEVEELQAQAAEVEALREQAAEAESLREQVAQLKKRRRLANEIDELRKQISELTSAERLLEQMLRQQLYG